MGVSRAVFRGGGGLRVQAPLEIFRGKIAVQRNYATRHANADAIDSLKYCKESMADALWSMARSF